MRSTIQVASGMGPVTTFITRRLANNHQSYDPEHMKKISHTLSVHSYP